jgi:hypothetical protein
MRALDHSRDDKRVFSAISGPRRVDSSIISFRRGGTVEELFRVPLACKSTEDELNEQERSEYEGYVRANKFIAILQKQARRLLGSES